MATLTVLEGAVIYDQHGQVVLDLADRDLEAVVIEIGAVKIYTAVPVDRPAWVLDVLFDVAVQASTDANYHAA